ncbi:MAG TPA: hypothetical protein PLY70_06080 [Saprospiraceae bacterium]|nr:hypothetical protein [Saprospiraceae bacterium]HPN68829.1 hypothetical protein [Saprospiraceae bacterium]
MSQTLHAVYIYLMASIVIAVTIYLSYTGYTYYDLPIEERFYHPQHHWFKPSGLYGQGLGVIGTALILFGVSIYIARKRYNFLGKLVRLKYLLEFHIFLCTLGPIMVLFHTAFKFGGIVSVAFWSMVAVVLSGVIGRFIYIQIPRTVEGRELSLAEVKNLQNDMAEEIQQNPHANEELLQIIKDNNVKTGSSRNSFINNYIQNRNTLRKVKLCLNKHEVVGEKADEILSAVRNEINISNKISRLLKMQQLFKYWHVAHLPFALIMLIVVIIHIAITVSFGYKWIF